MLVGLDPGHGGENKGCRGSGLCEEELTLRTAMAVRQAMLQRDPATRVLLTREVDDTVSLTERARRLQACDFVLCIHYDHAADAKDSTSGAIGCYAFADDVIARDAGVRIEELAPPVVRPKKAEVRNVSTSDWTAHAYNCLVHHRPRPALLVEVAFLSNLKHTAWLNGPEAMGDIANVLCDGIGVALLGVARRVAGPPAV